MPELVAAMVALAAVVGAVVWLVLILDGPVSPGRVREFCHRTQLPLTEANSVAVMRYLGTTRRWRACGVVIGLGYSLAAAWQQRMVSINGGLLFLGWFVGAMAAEWRVGLTTAGERRAAALVPRRGAQYVGRARLAACTLLLLAVAAVTAVDLASDQATTRHVGALVALVAALVVIGTGLAVGRHVLSRPQPASVDPSVIAADDILRRTSLRVVSGSVFALLAAVLGQSLIFSTLSGRNGWALLVVLGGAVAGVSMSGPLLGPSEREVAPPEVVAA